MSEFDENRLRMERPDPIASFGHVWVERRGSITIHLSVEEAEKLAQALPFTNALAKEIREALRNDGPISPLIVY
jgi:hypothetical protein